MYNMVIPNKTPAYKAKYFKKQGPVWSKEISLFFLITIYINMCHRVSSLFGTFVHVV